MNIVYRCKIKNRKKNSLFLTACRRFKDTIYLRGHTKSLTHLTSLYPWLTETERWNLHPPSLTWIKPGTQKMQFQLALNKTFCSTPTLPTHRLNTPNYKINKIRSLSPLPLVLAEGSQISELKTKFIFTPPRKSSRTIGYEVWFANH